MAMTEYDSHRIAFDDGEILLGYFQGRDWSFGLTVRVAYV